MNEMFDKHFISESVVLTQVLDFDPKQYEGTVCLHRDSSISDKINILLRKYYSNLCEIDFNELNLVSRNNEWGENKKISNQINTTLNKNSEKIPTN